MKQFFSMIILLLAISTLSAQPSKQDYTGWLETETEHFRIIYEEMSTETVVEILTFCEDVYNSVTAFFDSRPEKIDIVIHDRIDAVNGSYYPAPPHINMYVSAPSTTDFGAKIDNWLRFLLTHELTHYVNMTIKEGLFYQLSRVMGKGVSSIPGGMIPGWAIEGIAVKLESDLTGGGRGNNPFFEMYSKALILEDKLFSWRQAAYSSNHPPLSRIYVAGYIINDYMARTYGDDVYIRIYRDFLKFPLLGFNHYVKKITGNSIAELFTSMESDLKKEYSNIISVPGKLIFPEEESNYYLPVISDAGWIVYRETAHMEPALVLIDPESKKETILVKTSLSDYTSFSATRDGNIVVFAALEIDGKHATGLSAVSDLYIFKRDKNDVGRITTNSHLRQPALSPIGQRLVAVQKAGQYTRLVEIDIPTGEIKVLFEREKSYIYSPNFSKDGRSIAFTIQDDNERSIWILKQDGNLTSPGSDIPGDDYNPIFLKNNNIVYVSDMNGNLGLYEINSLIKGKPVLIHSDPVGIFSGLVSDNEIIYSTYSHSGYTLKTTPYADTERIVSTESVTFPNVPDMGIGKSNDENLIKPAFKPYRDTPELIIFSPVPFYLDPLYESKQIFGPGFAGYFKSILGKSIISTTVTMNITTLQPGASFNFSHDWGPIGMEYSLFQGYSPVSGIYNAQQTTRQQLIFDIPVVSRKKLNRTAYLGLFTGIIDDFSIISDRDFPFFSPDPMGNIEYMNNAYQINGFGFSISGNQSSRDIIPPFQINSSTFLYSPISQDFFTEHAIRSTNSINLPSPVNHQVFRFGGRLTWSEIDELTHLNSPRGFSIKNNSDIGITASVEYLFTIAVPDWPIFGGLSLQGIGGSIHVEKILSVQNNELLVDEDLYGGLEFITLGNYINVFQTAGLGLSYRFKPDSQGFSTENLGIYMFIGTNGFE